MNSRKRANSRGGVFRQISSAESLRRSSLCFRRFYGSIPRRRARLERVEKTRRYRRDFIHRRQKARFVHFRRFVNSTYLSHELQRRRPNLFRGNGRLEVEQRLDVSAHGMDPGSATGVHSARRAWMTSTRAARAAGSAEAMTAATRRISAERTHHCRARHFHVVEDSYPRDGPVRIRPLRLPRCLRRPSPRLRAITPARRLPRLRANRKPNAEFARSCANGKRQYAGHSDQRNRQRDEREASKHDRVETIRSQNFGAHVFERGGASRWAGRRTCRESAGDRRDQRVRIGMRMHEKTARQKSLLSMAL